MLRPTIFVLAMRHRRHHAQAVQAKRAMDARIHSVQLILIRMRPAPRSTPYTGF